MDLPIKKISLALANFDANHWIRSLSSRHFSILAGMDMSSSKWVKFVMKPNDLCFNAQDVANCASSWESIKDHVHQMHVFVRGGTEFFLDDIRLYGALF